MRRLIHLLPLAGLIALGGCHGGGSDHAQAKALIASHCVVCHVVPGVPGAVGKVGPPLTDIAARQVIAGKYSNTRANLVRWIMHPQAMLPGTAMPDMGITQAQAEQIADYLSTLDGQ